MLKEFLEHAPEGFQGHWLQAEEIPARCTAVRRNRLTGGIWSPHETTVDGREAVPRLLDMLPPEPEAPPRRRIVITRRKPGEPFDVPLADELSKAS